MARLEAATIAGIWPSMRDRAATAVITVRCRDTDLLPALTAETGRIIDFGVLKRMATINAANPAVGPAAKSDSFTLDDTVTQTTASPLVTSRDVQAAVTSTMTPETANRPGGTGKVRRRSGFMTQALPSACDRHPREGSPAGRAASPTAPPASPSTRRR